MVKHFDRKLKTAIRFHNNPWTEALLVVLLGTAGKEDHDATTVEMVYGQSLRLPDQFFDSQFHDEQICMFNFTNELR